MKLRSVLFWMHLACGVVAGVVIFIMSVTGALLTYQRQMTAWADMRGYWSEPSEGVKRLPADELLAKVTSAQPDLALTTIVIRSDARRAGIADGRSGASGVRQSLLGRGPGRGQRTGDARLLPHARRVASIRRDGGRQPCDGKGHHWRVEPDVSVHRAERTVPLVAPYVDVGDAEKHPLVPRRPFEQGARLQLAQHHRLLVGDSSRDCRGGRCRDFLPVGNGARVPAYGEQPPAPGGGAAARGGGPGGRAGGPGARNGGPGRRGGEGAEARQRTGASDGADQRENAEIPANVPLETLVAKAEGQMPDWKTISVALPSGNAPRVVLTLDAGDGGQPHKRATLMLNRRTGAVERWEPYSSQSAGRRARTWLRFAHTGEVYGLAGQTVAGLVTAGGAVLVFTGLALALRRFLSWRKRARVALAKAA